MGGHLAKANSHIERVQPGSIACLIGERVCPSHPSGRDKQEDYEEVRAAATAAFRQNLQRQQDGQARQQRPTSWPHRPRAP